MHEPEIRGLRRAETGQLEEFMYLSLFVPPGAEPFPRWILEKPEIKQYYASFGKKKPDIALVADAGGELVGAAWARILTGPVKGYGNIDDETPEFVLAVKEEYRGAGIGTMLLRALMQRLSQAGYRRLSLSVQKENRAFGLYRRLGFQIVEERQDDYLMAADLTR